MGGQPNIVKGHSVFWTEELKPGILFVHPDDSQDDRRSKVEAEQKLFDEALRKVSQMAGATYSQAIIIEIEEFSRVVRSKIASDYLRAERLLLERRRKINSEVVAKESKTDGNAAVGSEVLKLKSIANILETLENGIKVLRQSQIEDPEKFSKDQKREALKAAFSIVLDSPFGLEVTSDDVEEIKKEKEEDRTLAGLNYSLLIMGNLLGGLMQPDFKAEKFINGRITETQKKIDKEQETIDEIEHALKLKGVGKDKLAELKAKLELTKKNFSTLAETQEYLEVTKERLNTGRYVIDVRDEDGEKVGKKHEEQRAFTEAYERALKIFEREFGSSSLPDVDDSYL